MRKSTLQLFCFLLLLATGYRAKAQTDACGAATSLTVNATCTTTSYTVPASFTNDAADPALCTGTSYRDGWYKFTTDASTTSVIITGTSNRQMGLAVYSGACGSLTQVACIVPGAANATLTAAVLPNTTYYLRIARTNNASNNAMTGDICISKPCTSTNVPYTQNFQTPTPPALPTCTSKENTGGNAWNTLANPGYGFTGRVLAYVYNQTSAANAWFYTQGINLTAGTSYRVSYRYGNNSTTYTEKLDVYYGINAAFADMTNQLADHPAVTGATSAVNNVDFVAPTTGVYYFGFHAYSAADQFELYVDDISINLTPTCEKPVNLSKSGILANGATISWDAPASSSPQSYDLYHNTVNTAPTASTTPTITPITATTTTLSGLQPSTKYYYWVRSNCGTTNGYSEWTTIDSFTTACSATNVPYTQNFQSATPPALPNCTTKENAGNGNNWNTLANPGYGFTGRVLAYEYSETDAANAWFYTQGLNLTAGTSYRVSYRYGNNSTTYTEKLAVYYGNSPLATDMTNQLADHPAIIGAASAINAIDFVAATTGVYYFGFHAYSDADQFELYIDDISITVTPTCESPINIVASNITNAGADVTWDPPTVTSPQYYQLYYATSNTAPTKLTPPTIANIAGTSTTLALSGGTTYYVWVRSICSSTDTSAWSTPSVQIRTIPANDDCTNAITLVKGTAVQGTTVAATQSEIPSTCSSSTSTTANEVWYMFTADYNGSVTASVTNVMSGLDVVLQVYTGSCGAFTSVGCVDANATGSGETLTVNAVAAGTVYYVRVYAYTSSSNTTQGTFSINVTGSALPVSFTSFTGERRNSVNVLSWTTATETNNRGFEVQKSADGQQFSTIGFVNSHTETGNSSHPLAYTFTDAKPFAATNYYRLKQVDKDGQPALSKVITLQPLKAGTLQITSVYPNPAKEQIKIVYTSPKAQPVELLVTDITGKTIRRQAMQSLTGDNTSTVTLSALQAGTYFIRLVCADGCNTTPQKFVKE